MDPVIIPKLVNEIDREIEFADQELGFILARLSDHAKSYLIILGLSALFLIFNKHSNYERQFKLEQNRNLKEQIRSYWFKKAKFDRKFL